MSKLKKPGGPMKYAVAAVISIFVFAASYCLVVIVPTGDTLAFIQTVKAYGSLMAIGRWVVLAALYGIVLWKVDALLAKNEASPLQKRFLSDLRWQALLVLLFMEWLLGPHGLSQLAD